MQKTQVIEGHSEENKDVATNQDSSDMEISVIQVENQDRADVIVQGVGKGNSAEAWLDESGLLSIRDSLQFGHHHGVLKISRGSGLALFWKKNFDLHIESFSLNHIDVLINKGKTNVWHFVGFYGAPETHLRTESWDLLRSLHKKFSVPWICAGDFNELLKSHEKLGNRLRPYGQMEKFQEVLDECGLFDLGFWEINSPGLKVIQIEA
nr:hypothetical protein CFP56_67425 [Quercus suber]